jgi:carboxyl-terminal processing protease
MRIPLTVRWPVPAGLGVLVLLAMMLSACASSTPRAPQAAGPPPACAPLPPTPPPLKPPTLTTIEQAYYCIFAHQYAGPTLDDRDLLAGAFAGFAQELGRLGMDQPDATMPALTGHRDTDWNAFAAVYQHVTSQLHATAAQQQDLTAATMNGMVATLHDNHAGWIYPQEPPGFTPADTYGLGINTSPAIRPAITAPQAALPPLFVTSVDPGSPAARQGVRPGDVIDSVDGAPPFTDDMLSPGVFGLLSQQYPQHQAVQITVRWPLTGATRTITITPATYTTPASASHVTAKLLDGHIAYLRFSGFFPALPGVPGAGTQALTALANLEKQAKLRGVILDLRGNEGGDGTQADTLLGAFEHGTPDGYNCTYTGQCTADYPDASTPLLHLPLVVLTDHNCVSACDVFSGAVKDLHLGTLIGTRTAGIVAGVGRGYTLDDGSILGLTADHALGADHEIINGIGVAPDYYLPLTPRDVAAGHDPDIAKALALLNR